MRQNRKLTTKTPTLGSYLTPRGLLRVKLFLNLWFSNHEMAAGSNFSRSLNQPRDSLLVESSSLV